MSRRCWIKSKIVCFLLEDWMDFEQAICEEYPGARYFKESQSAADAFPDGEQPPVITFKSSLLETEPSGNDAVTMVLDEAWQPTYYKHIRKYYHGEEWSWALKGPPSPYIWFRLRGELYDYKRKPPTYPMAGQIDFYYDPDDKAHVSLTGKFYRLFAKFATNRKGLVYVKVPELEVTHPVPKGAMEWCGYHAIEWARQAPDRVLFPGMGLGIRPAE